MASWLREKYQKELFRQRDAREKGIYMYFTELQSTGTTIKVDGKEFTNFSSNDYLSLTHDPRVVEAAKKAYDSYGSGMCGSRLVVGTSTEHTRLEEKIAAWKGVEKAIVFTTGYQTLLGTVSSVFDPETTIVIDKLSHACVLDGCSLARGNHMAKDRQIRYFRHNDPKSLEDIVAGVKEGRVIIIVEGVYSMDGDIAKLPEFVEIAKKYDAVVAIDDAHGTGILGKTGRGTVEHFGLDGEVDITMGTFSKALGCVGGFVASCEEVIDHIKHTARSFLFSAAPPVSNIASVSTIIDIIRSEPHHLQNLRNNEKYFKMGLSQLGFDYAGSETAIVPIIVAEEDAAMGMAVKLYQNGIFMVPMVYPAVPKGQERLRCTITAGHSKEDLDRALERLEKIGKELAVIS